LVHYTISNCKQHIRINEIWYFKYK
jgi:hypothetical protein